MNSDKLKEWFLSLDKATQIEQIKKHAIQLHAYKKSQQKATEAELEYGFNRVGVRGGKFTSLNAKSDNCARMYDGCEEELKLMVKLL